MSDTLLQYPIQPYDPVWTDRDFPPPRRFRDALGLETFSEAILADLVPGINNQTRRARYYAFWAWVLHTFINDPDLDHSQVGFYQPVVGSASASHWIDSEYIYTIDYERGIDILKYKEAAPVPTTAEIDRSWLANVGKVSAAAAAERFVCKLAQDGAPALLK